MKIAQVCHTFLPHIGGIELYVYRLARDLFKKGAEVEVITTDWGIEKKESFSFPVRYFKGSPVLLRNPLALGVLFHFWKKDYDIIHLHSVWFWPSFWATLLRKKAKVVVTVHGVYPDEASFLVKMGLKFFGLIASYILKKADRIIALAPQEKEKLVRIFKVPSQKIEIIPNGIDAPANLGKVPQFIKKKYGLSKNKIILFTGRVIADKNPDKLVLALPEIIRDFRETKIVFVGPVDKEYKKKLLSLIPFKIRRHIVFAGSFHPVKERKKLYSFYKIADVFVSIGSWEGLPTRILEALSQETPVIAYCSGGSQELIKDGINGYLLEKLEAKLLEKKIVKSFRFLKVGSKFKETNRLLLKKYLWSYLFQEIESLYRKLCSKNAGYK